MRNVVRLTVLNGSQDAGGDTASAGDGQRSPVGTNGAVERGIRELVAGTPTQVRFGLHDRLLYATDASLYQETPVGVVVPSSPEVAAKVVGWCGRNGVPVLPRGGGTSLAGQCTNEAVVVDATPMCRGIGEVRREEGTEARRHEGTKGGEAGTKARRHARPGTEGGRQEVQPASGAWEGHWVEVEAGVTVDELNEELARRGGLGGWGLFFAPDPATTRQAAIGGCIGNNAAGSRSIRYGRTSENLLSIEAALSTGERVWFEAGTGERDAVARRIAREVIDVVRSVEPLIRERFPKTIRRNAGYGLDMVLAQLDAGADERTLDLSPLLCGSEGTLALTMRARVKLMPIPAARGLMVVSFASVEDAIAAVKPLLDAGVPLGLSAVEMLDDVVLDAARGNIEHRRYVELLPGADAERREPKAALYVEFSVWDERGGGAGSALSSLSAGFAAARRVLSAGVVAEGVRGVAEYTDAGAMLKAWALRRAGEPLLHGLPGPRKPITFVEDNAVPVERLGEFVRGFKEIVARHGTRAAYWAHASVGVLHVRPMIDLHDEADRARMVRIAVEVADLARACGGIMSGEHGDGKVRGPLLERFFGPELMEAFRRVKRAFDPAGVMNPGNIVGPWGEGGERAIAEGLRIDAGGEGTKARRHAPPGTKGEIHGVHDGSVVGVETYFDYSDQHGFMGAAEQCNGAGVCRKRSGGTMCPSYRGTQDERHSTRGRGNALRLALSGQVNLVDAGTPSFDDAETIETLDLCLSCKSCKSECPSNVDIARLKAEYTAQRYKRSGVPLKARFFGHVRLLNYLGSMTPGLANFVNGLGVTKAVLRSALGIDQRRSVPRFERPLWRWIGSGGARKHEGGRGVEGAGARGGQASPDRPVVVLYADCFTSFNEPRIGVAAVGVLEALGYRVRVLPERAGVHGCCGRAMISTGCLGDAVSTIDRTLEILAPAIDDPSVVAVVTCEPSCLSAIKDDWLQLKLDTPIERRRRLAAKSFLVEDFIENRWEEHPDRGAVGRLLASASAWGGAGEAAVVFHGHCHQKALWGAGSSASLLRRLFGARARVLETGCCGMAGSFGYTAAHYELSMRIGEETLFPAVRGASTDVHMCATGTSCRHQIHDGTGREAEHPIEVIDRLLNRG